MLQDRAEGHRLRLPAVAELDKVELREELKMVYLALFQPDAGTGGFVVTFPDIDDGVTQGETEEEATGMGADLLACMIGERINRDLNLPAPRKYRGSKYRPARLPALQEAKAELYNAFRAAGIRKAELARRIGISKTNIDRLFGLTYHSRLGQIEAALRALGKELAIAIRDAARATIPDSCGADQLA